MKMIGIAMVFVGCTLCGLVIDYGERQRLHELSQFIYLFELLKGEIDYHLTPLREACLHTGEHMKGIFKGLLRDFSRQIEAQDLGSVEEMWKQVLREHKGAFHLKEEDYQLLYSFGGACGYLDKTMQKKNLEMIIEKLTSEKEKATNRYNKRAHLNKSLGFLIGAALAIFLI